MAAVQNQTKIALFEQLFVQPSMEAMLALSWQDFQDFVAHVFTCAGYSVEYVANKFFPLGPGVDLNLYAGPVRGKPVARVEVRRYAPSNLLNFQDIAAFLGVLDLAQGVPGYMVTTSDFNGPAREAVRQATGRVRTVNGERLLRYITYIGGSRLGGEYAGVQVAPTHPTAPDWLEAADEVGKRTARPPRQTRVLVVANTKGGVAKTTSVLNIGFALSDLQKQRVLLVDLDGQASLTKSVPREAESGAPKNALPPPDTLTLADYFRGQATLQSVLRSTRFPNLHLAPAHHDMYRLQFGGAERARAELRFVEDLRMLSPRDLKGQAQPPFDWIVVDTPAGDSFYVRAALAASDYVVFPAYAETFAQLGIEEVLRTAKTMGALMGPVECWMDRLLGCAITRWKPGANANDNLAKLRLALNNEGILLFQQPIPLDDKVETANRGTVGGGIRNIFRLSPQMGQAAKAYDELVKGMVDHVNRREAKAQHH